MIEMKTEVRDGMRIVWNSGIPMDDGVVLRSDMFCPIDDGKYPVILSCGPYCKGLWVGDGYPDPWRQLLVFPEISAGTTNQYQTWEVIDPEKWIPDNYVILRIDGRGSGNSPGFLDFFSPREHQDVYQCIEWAADQPWSNGKVGMTGISYYAIKTWHAASVRPPHLAAICAWEGCNDFYRDWSYHGGILNTFSGPWVEHQIRPYQYGRANKHSRVTEDLINGDVSLSDEGLGRNICDFYNEIKRNPLDNQYHRDRSAKLENITVPLLSAGNWGGNGLHLRGNIEGFVNAASQEKWLEMHGGTHFEEFYKDRGIILMKRFFDYFLKGVDNNWDKERKVQLQIRHLDKFVERHEDEWPIARTQWTKFFLQPSGLKLSTDRAQDSAKIEFDALGPGLTFISAPMERETEITGPLAAKLFVSSSTADADLFLVYRVFTPEMHEVTFQGNTDPHTPIAQGWLRASHRKLDPVKTLPYRPYHTHDELQPLEPDVPVELDIEIWPTCIAIPAGCRIALSVRGKDYVCAYAEEAGEKQSHFINKFKGCGPFLHVDPQDRPVEIFGGRTTLHFDSERMPFLLVPVIPK